MTGNVALIAAIRDAIAESGGRITFARFMKLALYHPQHGYYTSGRARIGKSGDFFTSVSVGPIFGRILARQLRQFRADLGEPNDFTNIEFGGHHGQLREDILAAAPELAYRVIENNDSLPAPFTGCVLSNELLDALPVHRVAVIQGEWRELYVTADFTEQPGPLSTPHLADQLHGLPTHLMEGYRTEINLRALDWLDAITARLTRGYIITIDYGFERNDYFAPHRRDGHLQCYHQHTRNADAFLHIGEQDITAHINFTSIIEHGRILSLEPVVFTDQGKYLMETGATEIAEIINRTAGQLSSERNAIHQLTHPNLMGRAFRVLIQRKLS